MIKACTCNGLAVGRGHPEHDKLVCVLYSPCIHRVKNNAVTGGIYHVHWKTNVKIIKWYHVFFNLCQCYIFIDIELKDFGLLILKTGEKILRSYLLVNTFTTLCSDLELLILGAHNNFADLMCNNWHVMNTLILPEE